ncbi:hypothetical protein ACN2XU_13410 [Primorskyibacter sp. 2E107]|uniref:hypothetical protein n=1 Tax=Primorskyibacter sp. 2E107 TaxID=3403458 RepID=UPI003AF542E7
MLFERNQCILTLSLYADDITISGVVVPKALIWEIKKLIFGNGLRSKASKEVSLMNAPADITGVIVKDSATHLPNRQLKRLAELMQERAKTTNPKLQQRIDNQIAGAFLSGNKLKTRKFEELKADHCLEPIE